MVISGKRARWRRFGIDDRHKLGELLRGNGGELAIVSHGASGNLLAPVTGKAPEMVCQRR